MKMKKQDKAQLNRRQFMMGLFTGAGALGLRSLLLGLPPVFLTQRAMAATTQTGLIFSTRQASCPVNANVPGTYGGGLGLFHPAAYDSPVTFSMGGNNYRAAQPWADLSQELRDRFQFFHYSSMSNAHPEIPAVMKVHSALKAQSGSGPEMLPSAISQELAESLGTIQKTPVILDNLRFNLTYDAIAQSSTSPGSVKSLFGASQSTNQKAMMEFRDQQLDNLYKDLKSNGTKQQKKFLDDYAISRTQARQLSIELGSLLADVTGGNGFAANQTDQVLAAVAVIASKTAPVAVISLFFGGDNHRDTNLTGEANSLVSATQNIQLMYDRLKALGIHDSTTFALQNVFGRTLQTRMEGGNMRGRDHNSEHAVMLMHGPNVNPGVTGGIRSIDGHRAGEARPINSATGGTNNTDIPKNQTLASAGKTLMAACGIDENKVNERITTGKVVSAAIKS